MLPAVPSDTYNHIAHSPMPKPHVWANLQQAESWRAIGGISEIRDAKYDGGELRGFNFISSVAGTPYRGIATKVSSVTGEAMSIDIETSELTARLDVKLSEVEADGTHLDVAMTLRSKSFLASMMWGLISVSVGSGLGARVQEMVDSFDRLDQDS